MSIVVLSEERLDALHATIGRFDCRFRSVDGGDVFSAIAADGTKDAAAGSLFVTSASEPENAASFGKPEDTVRVVARWSQVHPRLRPAGPAAISREWAVRGYVLRSGTWQEATILVVPVRQELYSRTRGLIETDLLADNTVFFVGLGSMGSVNAVQSVQSGVGRVILMDHDRIECANLVRHVAGVSDLGRLKVNVVADAIREKNPYAEVERHPVKVTWRNLDLMRECVRRSDLVVCMVDDITARSVVNRACVLEGKPLIIAGAFRRAYGGQVHFIRPGVGPCYECFLKAFPKFVMDQEVASWEHAERLAYTDRPVVPEPGLANDIAPINQMAVKLALHSLLEGKQTALRCLDEDLTAHFYIWLNRREPGTDWDCLKPMKFDVDGVRILRWYGIEFYRDPQCRCCGDSKGGGGLDLTGLDSQSRNLDMCQEKEGS